MPNITEEELELIDQYLKDQLPPHEKKSFEERLAIDTAWKQKFEEIKLLSLGIQEAALREILPTFDRPKRRVQARVVSIGWVTKIAAAAVFAGVLLTIGWFLFRRPAEERLYARFYQPDPGLPTEMGIADNYEFSRGMVDYKTTHYKDALARWEKLLLSNTAGDTLNYFVGCASLATGDLSKAVTCFTRVTQNGQSVFEKEAYWYMGLALLKQRNNVAAAAAIRQSDHPGSDTLLAEIKD